MYVIKLVTEPTPQVNGGLSINQITFMRARRVTFSVKNFWGKALVRNICKHFCSDFFAKFRSTFGLSFSILSLIPTFQSSFSILML